MGRIEIPHPVQGHKIITWNGKAPENWAEEMTEEEARTQFNELIAAGFGAAVTREDGTEEFTRKFDRGAKVIKMIPRFKGG